ncbi:MAG: glycosyltransferase family 4 protein [Pararhodobacter sp.]
MKTAFAIPGNLHSRTGGYIYERRMLESLPEIGVPTQYIPLIPSYPDPTAEATADAAAKLGALGPETVLILDGLVFGSLETEILASLACPIVAMLHHPLGLEAGLSPERAAALIARETANLRHAAHVVVPSAHTRDILIARFGVKPGDISVALPGFDRPTEPAIGVPRVRPPLILSVGLICRRKGHDVLLDALAQLHDLDWQCVIVGMTHDESVRQALLGQRTELGLHGRVRFTGEISEAELDALWRQAHLFALATRYEGYGMVLSEAQLYGLPILSCRVGAVPQTVSAQEAILTPPDDAPAFAAALSRLLTDPALHARMGHASRSAGEALPRWHDAARVMQAAVERARARQESFKP